MPAVLISCSKNATKKTKFLAKKNPGERARQRISITEVFAWIPQDKLPLELHGMQLGDKLAVGFRLYATDEIRVIDPRGGYLRVQR